MKAGVLYFIVWLSLAVRNFAWATFNHTVHTYNVFISFFLSFISLQINGCKDISVKPLLLGLSGQHGQRTVVTGFGPRAKLVIKATVRETATNVSLNATDTETEVVSKTTKLQFLTTTPKSFKRGMPFTGQVKPVYKFQTHYLFSWLETEENWHASSTWVRYFLLFLLKRNVNSINKGSPFMQNWHQLQY